MKQSKIHDFKNKYIDVPLSRLRCDRIVVWIMQFSYGSIIYEFELIYLYEWSYIQTGNFVV